MLNPENQFDLIVSNPPYVPRDEYAGLQREIVEYEPEVAFLGGEGDALDLVLCDWNIREPSGIDLLRYVRKETPELLFIMVTGARDLDTVIEARRAGATAYIVKPYSLDELRRKLSHVLAIQRIQEEVA